MSSVVGGASKFVVELSQPEYGGRVKPIAPGNVGSPKCDECGGGLLVPRVGEFGGFWGCSNYPSATEMPSIALVVKLVPLYEMGCFFPVRPPSVDTQATFVRDAKRGAWSSALVSQGLFLGCSEWRPEGSGPSCNFTKPI